MGLGWQIEGGCKNQWRYHRVLIEKVAKLYHNILDDHHNLWDPSSCLSWIVCQCSNESEHDLLFVYQLEIYLVLAGMNAHGCEWIGWDLLGKLVMRKLTPNIILYRIIFYNQPQSVQQCQKSMMEQMSMISWPICQSLTWSLKPITTLQKWAESAKGWEAHIDGH